MKELKLPVFPPRSPSELFCTVVRVPDLYTLTLEASYSLISLAQGSLQRGPSAEVYQLVILPEATGISASVLKVDPDLM